MNRLYREARSRLRRDGVGRVTEDAVDFAYRRTLRPTLERIVSRWLDTTVVDATELQNGEVGEQTWQLAEENNAFSRALLDEVVPLREEDGLTYNDFPTYVFRQPFVTAIDEVTLLGSDPVALTRDGRVLSETIHTTANPHHRRITRAATSAFLDSPRQMVSAALGRSRTTGTGETVDCAAVLQSRWNNYYHWTLEHLPKLRGIAHYEQETGETVSLVVQEDPPSFVTESLELLGYGDRIVEWDGTKTHVETLVLPSFPELLPRTLDWLRDRAFDSVAPATDGPDWIYLSREGAKKRRVVNESALASVFETHGVETVHPERLSMREEIALVQSVEGVIGPHGAGLTAILWGEDLSVVELFNDVVKPPYYTMATVLGHDYAALSGQPVDSGTTERNRDFTVDPTALDELLSQRE